MWFVSGLRIGNAKRTGFGDLPRDRRTSPHKVNKLVIAFFVSLLRPYLIATTYSFFFLMLSQCYCRANATDGGFLARIPYLIAVTPLLFIHERLDTKASN